MCAATMGLPCSKDQEKGGIIRENVRQARQHTKINPQIPT